MQDQSNSLVGRTCVIDPKELTKLVKHAILEGELEADRIERERTPEALALAVIARIPECIQKAVIKRRASAVIMHLHYDQGLDRPPGQEYGACKPEWLTGAAKLVWDACVASKLSPRLEYWADAGESRFDLHVHWNLEEL